MLIMSDLVPHDGLERTVPNLGRHMSAGAVGKEAPLKMRAASVPGLLAAHSGSLFVADFFDFRLTVARLDLFLNPGVNLVGQFGQG